MPNYTAPGVYYTIQDLSQYAAPISISTCGCVGGATKGPISGDYNYVTKSYNTPTLITTPEEFVITHGIPDPDFQGPYAALLYLQQGSQLYYARVAATTPIFRVANDTKLVLGREYIVVSGTVEYDGISYGTGEDAGDRFTAISDGDTGTVGLSGITNQVVIPNSAKAAARMIDSSMTIVANSKGSWGNELGYRITNPGGLSDFGYTLYVYERVDGEEILRETIGNLSIKSRDENYWPTKVNGTSRYVNILTNGTLTAQPSVTTEETTVWLNNDYNLSDSDGELCYFNTSETYNIPAQWKTAEAGEAIWIRGSNGQIPTSYDLIGTPESVDHASGLYAFEDSELTDISMLMVPGYTQVEVLTTFDTIIRDRADCFGILSTPLGKNLQESVDWHNDKLEGTSSKLINNPYIGMYWPWVEIYDPYNKVNLMVAPVGFAAKAMAYTDNVSYPWMAPAGIQRGLCTEAIRLEFNATKGQREQMYGPGNGNALNPLVNLPLDGIAIYGQRTMQRTASALDRIDVARMMIYMAKVLQRSVRPLVFEKNNEILWNRFKLIVNPFISHIKSCQGVDDFNVVCDKSTTTDYHKNINEMHGYILLVPTKTAEKVVMNFCLFPSGSSLEIPRIG